MMRKTDNALPHGNPETAGHLATKNIPLFAPTTRVAMARASIRKARYDAVDLVIVSDDDGRYAGAIPLRTLVEAEEHSELSSILSKEWPTVSDSTDQEHALNTSLAASRVAVPVIDADGRAIGILTPQTLLDVLSREHREDVHRLVGILNERSDARHALEDPPLRRFARRLPWLLVGLALSSVATAVMASFERTLKTHVMIAFFIPALVYLTDAIGTQTEAMAVRGLSVRHRPLPALLLNELATGALIGLSLGVVTVLGILMTFGDWPIALSVGLSLLIAGTLASGLGLGLPWVLSRIGVDPAFGAGPVATILQDVLTITTYFFVVTRVVGLPG